MFVIDNLKIGHGEGVIIENQGQGIAQPHAMQIERDLGSPLPASGKNQVELRGCRLRKRRTGYE